MGAGWDSVGHPGYKKKTCRGYATTDSDCLNTILNLVFCLPARSFVSAFIVLKRE